MRLPTKVLPLFLAGVFAGCTSGVDYLIMPPMGATWQVSNEQEQRGVQRFRELVREGETLDNWTELITWQSFKKISPPVPPETLLNSQREYLQGICPGVVWNIIERKEKIHIV